MGIRRLVGATLAVAISLAGVVVAAGPASSAICPPLRSGIWTGTWVQTTPVPGSGTLSANVMFTDGEILGTMTFAQAFVPITSTGPVSGTVTCGAVEFNVVLNGVVNTFTATLAADGASLTEGLWFRFEPFPNLVGGTWSASVSDSRPVLAVGETVVLEGDTVSQKVAVPVVLSEPSSTPVSAQYATADVTATGGTDYVPRSGTVTFNPGASGLTAVTKWITVTVLPDDVDETDELLTVTLSNPVGAELMPALGGGVMIYDATDTDPGIQFGFSFGNIYEGDTGRPVMKVTASLTAPAPTVLTVEWATGDASAHAPSDYLPKSGVLTFLPGQTAKTLSLPVRGDAEVEFGEGYELHVIDVVGTVTVPLTTVPIGIYET